MSHPRRWLILVVLCLSTAVLVIDNMVLNVAIPPLAGELGASAQDIQWITESYMLVFAGLLLTAGSLSDRYGRRRVLIIGLALFGLASLAATVAGDPGQLIAARAVMGVGGALIMPSTLSILITVFDEEERRKAMAAWSAVAMTGMTALVCTIIELPEHGPFQASALPAVAALAAFVIWELRTPHPMVPLGLFRNPDFSGGSLSLTLVQIGNGGLLIVLTQYLQFVLGYTPTQAGLAFIPMAVASLACNALGATLGARVGNRALASGGMVVVAGAFALLATVSAGDGFWVTGAALFLLGAGGAWPRRPRSPRSWAPCRRSRPGSAPRSTTRFSRWAPRSAWPSWAAWSPPASPAPCPPASSSAPPGC
ncbi:MFS transporter [Nonomuraea thailandensis]